MQGHNCSFDLDNYDIRKKLSFEKVSAVDRKTNKEVDITVFEERPVDSFLIIRRGLAYNNAFISQYLDLPGIVKLIEYRLPLAKSEENSKYIKKGIDFSGFVSVFEHMKYDNVTNLISEYISEKGSNEINPTVLSKMIFGIAAIMKQIHSRNICLETLSLDSISLDDNLEPHISKLGSAHFAFNQDDISRDPSLYYPEEFPSIQSSFANDVYAFGSLILRIFITRMGSIHFMCFLEKLDKKPELIPDAYWDLVKKCTNKNIEELPSFIEITELLKDDKFALELFNEKTDLNALHEYQNRIDDKTIVDIQKQMDEYKSKRMYLT